MTTTRKKHLVTAIGTLAAASFSLSTFANTSDNPFQAEDLGTGYEIAGAEGNCGEGRCGNDEEKDKKDDKESEGKCGEGKCGEGKCGEGKCGNASAATKVMRTMTRKVKASAGKVAAAADNPS